jgi:hypothetical protein
MRTGFSGGVASRPSRRAIGSSRSTPGARQGVRSNGTSPILTCPCEKVPPQEFPILGENARITNSRVGSGRHFVPSSVRHGKMPIPGGPNKIIRMPAAHKNAGKLLRGLDMATSGNKAQYCQATVAGVLVALKEDKGPVNNRKWGISDDSLRHQGGLEGGNPSQFSRRQVFVCSWSHVGVVGC